MSFNSIKILSLFSISLLCLSTQCNKRLDCANNIYKFSFGIKAYPDQDSIHVGDTIWLEINEPVSQTDIQTGNMINYSGAVNLGTAISFAKLITVNNTEDQVASKFKYLLIAGTEVQRSDSAKYREYNFAEISSYYRFKLALLPTETGIFKMFVSNASNVYRTNDNCTKASFQIDFQNTNQHFYFNEVSFPGISLSGKNGVYLFKVN